MILLDPHARVVVGHRGHRTRAPENTLESLREAVAVGVDAVEFDLRVTRDGALVLMHDETLERTTDGRGPVSQRTLSELRRLDAGARFTADGARTFPWRERGVRVPTFDEAIESLPSELPCIVELKTAEAAEPVKVAIRRHGIAARVIVAAFDPAATRPLRGAGFALGASTPEVARLLLPALAGRHVAPRHFQALCIPPRWHGLPLPIAALARALRGSGTAIHVWTIDDPADARALWQAGVQGIISDDPAAMIEARRAATA